MTLISFLNLFAYIIIGAGTIIILLYPSKIDLLPLITFASVSFVFFLTKIILRY